MPELLLVHVPLTFVSAVVPPPAHATPTPVIAAGNALTVTSAVLSQPSPDV